LTSQPPYSYVPHSAKDKYQTTYSTTNLKSLGDIDNNEFLKQYLINFDKNYIICINDFSLIRKKWLSYAARLNQEIKVKRKDNIDIGIFRGIDEHGFLLLEQSGKQQKISVAEVFF
jgi:biotin-(acetyl-CoA carboxylase) ligase